MSHRVVPIGTYSLVFAALLAMLALTVAVAFLPLGGWGPVAAMSIAVAKATLIMLYFMHLRQEEGLVRVFAVSGVVWLLLLFTLLLSDYLTRADVVRAV
jgi:cytochrome c oxidase subunit 4